MASMETGELALHCMDIGELPVQKLIVYMDRAEVHRQLRTKVPAGKSLVQLTGLSPVIEGESIRVEAMRNATILEVRYEEAPSSNVASNPLQKQITELEQKRSAVESLRASLDDEVHVLRKRLEVLDGVAGQIGQSVLVPAPMPLDAEKSESNNPTPARSGFLLCEDAMKNLTCFLDYYGKAASEMRQDLREKDRQLLGYREQIDTMERALDQLRCKQEYDGHRRYINIRIERKCSGGNQEAEDGEVELRLIYHVYCVSWRPCYDLRASTSDDFEEATTVTASHPTENHNVSSHSLVTLLYYGLVEQKTDEEWCNVQEVVLSTATPCMDGVLPSMPTLTAGFVRNRQLSWSMRQRNHSARMRRGGPISNNSRGEEEDGGIGSYDYQDFTDAQALHRLTLAQLTANSATESESTQNVDSMPPAFFAVQGPVANIASDGHYHKVVIAKMELEAAFFHEAMPSKVASAYVSVSTVNSTPMPFLAGQASIFLNNNFITTTYLKTVMPGEELRCLLGIDNAVKIDYKPASRTYEQVGFVSKSSLATHEQLVELWNTKASEPVSITVREPIPKSLDDKIKINLTQPDLKAKDKQNEARLTKEGNLEWSVRLSPGERRQLAIKWTTEYPTNESLVISCINNNGPASTHCPTPFVGLPLSHGPTRYC